MKSIAAYRTGLDLAPDTAVRHRGGGRRGPLAELGGSLGRLADQTLQRFLIWCGVPTSRLPVQFHVGYGDSDVDLHRCNPLLLTPLLRAIQPPGSRSAAAQLPFHREAGYLAQVFPQVYVDAGLATGQSGRPRPALLAEALELAPYGKFLYSSDAFGLPELFYLGAMLFRTALSGLLVGRVGRKSHLFRTDRGAADPDALRRMPTRLPARRSDVMPDVVIEHEGHIGQRRAAAG